MAWEDFYRRRDALDAVLAHAERQPDARVTVDDVPAARAEFTDTDSLLRALQHKWMRTLTGRVGLALDELEQDPEVDRVDAVSDAYRRTAEENPALRSVLDAHAEHPSEDFHQALQSEQRMLALSAGLAAPSESAADIARVGRAFVGLLRVPSPDAGRRPRSGVMPLLRKLAPSA